MAARNFPGPNVNTTTEMDPMMVRRPPNHLEIGARPSTLRAANGKSSTMGLDHVKDQNAK